LVQTSNTNFNKNLLRVSNIEIVDAEVAECHLPYAFIFIYIYIYISEGLVVKLYIVAIILSSVAA
jgi:hypothetical protein